MQTPKNLIDVATDSEGVEVEIEIKNHDPKLNIADKEIGVTIEYRMAKDPNTAYGLPQYFPGEPFTEVEMEEAMKYAKGKLEEIKF